MFNFWRQCSCWNASVNSFWNTIFIYFTVGHVTLSESRIFYSMLVWQLKLCDNKLLLLLLPNFLFFVSIRTWKRPAIPFLKFSSVNELTEVTYRFSIWPFLQCAKKGWSENLSILDLRSINWRLTSFIDFLDHVWNLGDLNYKQKYII